MNTATLRNDFPCRLCSARTLETAFVLPAMPRWNHRLLKAAEVAGDRPVDIHVQQCASCGFFSTALNLDDDYYDEYLNVPSLSAQARSFQASQAREFVERFGLVGRKVLEIGCGDGFFLHALAESGARVHGIEPSAGQRKVAEHRGLMVEGGVLSGLRVLPAGPFDAFVTRQVLEHVDDIRDFLLTVRANLTPGAAGLVEVPNLDKLVAERRFFDFIPEHVNYFSPRTLRLALELAGFDVVEVAPVDNGESLRGFVRWSGLPTHDGLAQRAVSLRADVAGFVARCRTEGKRVAIWGAGGKGISMMAVADLQGIDLLVDADPGKHGYLTPASHRRVEPPAELARQGIGAIIVMAPAYEREIAARLRGELGFRGDIVLAGRAFELLGPEGDPK
jgi:SAM-dependent methyltransferase